MNGIKGNEENLQMNMNYEMYGALAEETVRPYNQ